MSLVSNGTLSFSRGLTPADVCVEIGICQALPDSLCGIHHVRPIFDRVVTEEFDSEEIDLDRPAVAAEQTSKPQIIRRESRSQVKYSESTTTRTTTIDTESSVPPKREMPSHASQPKSREEIMRNLRLESERNAREQAKIRRDAQTRAFEQMKARQEAEMKAREQAKASREAEMKAKYEAEMKSRQEAKARYDAQMREKYAQEMKAREQAKAQYDAEMKARQEARKPVKPVNTHPQDISDYAARISEMKALRDAQAVRDAKIKAQEQAFADARSQSRSHGQYPPTGTSTPSTTHGQPDSDDQDMLDFIQNTLQPNRPSRPQVHGVPQQPFKPQGYGYGYGQGQGQAQGHHGFNRQFAHPQRQYSAPSYAHARRPAGPGPRSNFGYPGFFSF